MSGVRHVGSRQRSSLAAASGSSTRVQRLNQPRKKRAEKAEGPAYIAATVASKARAGEVVRYPPAPSPATTATAQPVPPHPFLSKQTKTGHKSGHNPPPAPAPGINMIAARARAGKARAAAAVAPSTRVGASRVKMKGRSKGNGSGSKAGAFSAGKTRARAEEEEKRADAGAVLVETYEDDLSSEGRKHQHIIGSITGEVHSMRDYMAWLEQKRQDEEWEADTDDTVPDFQDQAAAVDADGDGDQKGGYCSSSSSPSSSSESNEQPGTFEDERRVEEVNDSNISHGVSELVKKLQEVDAKSGEASYEDSFGAGPMGSASKALRSGPNESGVTGLGDFSYLSTNTEEDEALVELEERIAKLGTMLEAYTKSDSPGVTESTSAMGSAGATGAVAYARAKTAKHLGFEDTSTASSFGDLSLLKEEGVPNIEGGGKESSSSDESPLSKESRSSVNVSSSMQSANSALGQLQARINRLSAAPLPFERPRSSESGYLGHVQSGGTHNSAAAAEDAQLSTRILVNLLTVKCMTEPIGSGVRPTATGLLLEDLSSSSDEFRTVQQFVTLQDSSSLKYSCCRVLKVYHERLLGRMALGSTSATTATATSGTSGRDAPQHRPRQILFYGGKPAILAKLLESGFGTAASEDQYLTFCSSITTANHAYAEAARDEADTKGADLLLPSGLPAAGFSWRALIALVDLGNTYTSSESMEEVDLPKLLARARLEGFNSLALPFTDQMGRQQWHFVLFHREELKGSSHGSAAASVGVAQSRSLAAVPVYLLEYDATPR
ncbi:unnamed protein product [Chrysoparadoxa australica]